MSFQQTPCIIVCRIIIINYSKRESFMKIGFDNDKYLKMQSEHIRERIGKLDNQH